MPDPAGVEEARAGLRSLEGAPGVAAMGGNVVAARLVERLNQAQQEQAGAVNLENIQNPGKFLKSADVADIVSGIIKHDELDAAGNPHSSADQNTRKLAIEATATMLFKAGREGVGSLTTAESAFLRGTIRNFMTDWPDIDTIIPGFTALSESRKDRIINHYLGNPAMQDKILEHMTDALASGEEALSYDILHALLGEVKDSDSEIGVLQTELTATGGLNDQLTAQQAEVKKYEVEVTVDPRTNAVTETYGSKADVKRQIEARIIKNGGIIESFPKAIKETGSAVQRLPFPPGTPPEEADFFNPITGANESVTRADWLAKKHDLELERLRIANEVRKDKAGIDKIGAEEETVRTRLSELEAEKNSKDAMLKTKQEQKTEKEKEIAVKQKTIADAQQQLINTLKNASSQALQEAWFEQASKAGEARSQVKDELTKQVQKKLQEKLRGDMVEIRAGKPPRLNKAQFMTWINELKGSTAGTGPSEFAIARLNQMRTARTLTAEEIAVADQMIAEYRAGTTESMDTFSKGIVGEVLRAAALRDPKLLKEVFTHDEGAVRVVQNDILPGLIAEASADPAMRSELNKLMGQDVVADTNINKLKNMIGSWDKDKVFKALLILLAGAGILVFGMPAIAAMRGG